MVHARTVSYCPVLGGDPPSGYGGGQVRVTSHGGCLHDILNNNIKCQILVYVSLCCSTWHYMVDLQCINECRTSPCDTPAATSSPPDPSMFLKKVSTSSASCAMASLAELKDSSLEKSKAFQSMGPLSLSVFSRAGTDSDTARSMFLLIGMPGD